MLNCNVCGWFLREKRIAIYLHQAKQNPINQQNVGMLHFTGATYEDLCNIVRYTAHSAHRGYLLNAMVHFCCNSCMQ